MSSDPRRLSGFARLFGSALDWLDRRAGLRGLIRSQLTDYRLPASSLSWLTVGGLLLVIFALQLGTGILLLFHFSADPGEAFASLQRIRREVPFGWLIQALHAHGGNLMVAVVLIHMLRHVWLGAYKAPRELNWITGCLLLLLTLGAGLTGYILPWSQISYWATTVVTSSLEMLPVVGPELMRALRGGDLVGDPTFRRAFAAHVALIPLAMLALIGLHLYLLRLHGSAAPPRRRGSPVREEPTLPFYPDFVLQDARVVVLFGLCLVGLVSFAPDLFSNPDSFLPADPLDTPPNVKPEWYFLWSYQLLRMLPEAAALTLQGLLFGLLFALPFLDRGPHRHPRDRIGVLALFGAGTVLVVGLTVLGMRS